MIVRKGHIARRAFVLGCALAFAGCAQPQLTTGVQGGLSVEAVNVRAEAAEPLVQGRPNSVTNAELAADVTSVLTKRLSGRAGETPANVLVDVQKVTLVPRGAAVLAPVQSTSRVLLSVTNAETGEELVAPTEVVAASAQVRLPGLIGVATAPTVEDDYAAVLQGLANAVEKRLYGEES